MPINYNSLNKQLERALARNAAKKQTPATQAEPVEASLSEEEIQHHIDKMLEASKPAPTSRLERLMNESADLTHKILLERYQQ
ncbi:hypothetical protein [Pseudomonas sp. KU43P]|uniref:hypothetical protein n=1 Tax=Pseudomonas sp. KU43P TaxID=2487887 RepID=UPI0012A8274E|nr:hypothetical protein [Pseudomonas sp. KU43P]BBH44844.1 hypothetical protein KU43P_13210 [Pseudomonas sp. KU43P]